MYIQLGYDIRFNTLGRVPFIALLNVHPSRRRDLRQPDLVRTDPNVPHEKYLDSFGNLCVRVVAPGGDFRFHSSTVIQDSGLLDAVSPEARQLPIEYLPEDTLQFLLPSRYCESDLLANRAMELFGNTTPGWPRVQAICGWVHQHITFGYEFARSNRTAMEAYQEGCGVCRDFQHLAVAFCRAMNIPARYATGYLGDIGVPISDTPMDFSAWFEVFLEDRWWTWDARHNAPRIGRVLMAVGRDAADVAITTSFGVANLTQFSVVTDEIHGDHVPPISPANGANRFSPAEHRSESVSSAPPHSETAAHVE